MLALALLVVASAPLRLELEPQVGCRLGERLPEQLQRLGLAQLERGRAAVLRVRADGEALAVRLTDSGGATLGARRLPAREEDCAVLPETIGLLVRSWLLTARELPAPKPRAAALASDAPQPPPEVEPEPEPEAAVAAPAPVPSVTRPPASSGVDPHATRFAAMVSGGASSGPLDRPVATLTIRGELALTRRWAVALEGGVQSNRSNGDVSVALRWAGLSGCVGLWWGDRDLLLVAASVELVQLDAIAGTLAAATVLPAVSAHVEERLSLARGLFALLRLNAQARLLPQEIRTAGSSLYVPTWGFGAELGLGWSVP